MVRKKNVLSMAMQSFVITCLVTVLWFVVGYSLAFTPGGALFGSLDKAFLMGVMPESLFATVPETVFICFQLTFAIITVALIMGAVAERMKIGALLIFSGVWLLAVYVPIAHMVWGGGFLGSAGVLDFAGGTVVHVNSGVAGLVAALMLGKRVGYGRENMQPHNLVLSLIGASLLWVGWFGFNAGSAVASNGLAGLAMLVTQIARDRRAHLDGRRMGASGQTECARRGLRRGRRPRRDHAGIGLRRPGGGAGDRRDRRLRLLSRDQLPEEAARL